MSPCTFLDFSDSPGHDTEMQPREHDCRGPNLSPKSSGWLEDAGWFLFADRLQARVPAKSKPCSFSRQDRASYRNFMRSDPVKLCFWLQCWFFFYVQYSISLISKQTTLSSSSRAGKGNPSWQMFASSVKVFRFLGTPCSRLKDWVPLIRSEMDIGNLRCSGHRILEGTPFIGLPSLLSLPINLDFCLNSDHAVEGFSCNFYTGLCLT
ncbi:uncharacterized protein LOC132889089 [Neoarius graeffei]|uniref:uncharacterized protein LOC132889089 n=1 Tax=Neoarius graeffei TaxID=443677 RepID=UPI00298CE22C|nr:uncharacterized protein LOC132889089 [Neoarius graeffei]